MTRLSKRSFWSRHWIMIPWLLVLSILLVQSVVVETQIWAAESAATVDAESKTQTGRDVYYKTEGIVSGQPAPKTSDDSHHYPRYNFESRVLIWFANQQHLYYGSFVLAVPIFCMIIEFLGVVTKDRTLGKRYDRL